MKGMAFEHALDLRVTRKHKDGVSVALAIRPDLLNSNGVLHGGVIASLADEAAWWAIHHHFDQERACTTTELKVNYLLPISGAQVTARAYLVRAGKTLCVSRVDIFDDRKRLAALSTVTYILLS